MRRSLSSADLHSQVADLHPNRADQPLTRALAHDLPYSGPALRADQSESERITAPPCSGRDPHGRSISSSERNLSHTGGLRPDARTASHAPCNASPDGAGMYPGEENTADSHMAYTRLFFFSLLPSICYAESPIYRDIACRYLDALNSETLQKWTRCRRETNFFKKFSLMVDEEQQKQHTKNIEAREGEMFP